MQEQIKLEIGNRFEELKVLKRKVRAFMGTVNLPANVIHKTNLVLEEMLTNAIKYGYDDNKTHKIEIDLKITTEHVCIKITDDGKEFNPTRFPAPETGLPLAEMKFGGLGISVVRNISDGMIYKRDKGRNVLQVKIGALDE